MSKLFNKSFRFDVEITKANQKENKFFVEGYASTSDLDRQGDIICKQALEKAAESLLKVNNTVFYGHEYDLNNAVGKIVEAKADDIGLKVKIYVSEWAEELRTKLNEGIINKFSIGGRVSKDRPVTREEAVEQDLVSADVPFDNINIIEGIDLFEVSFVGVPANPNAQVVGLAKALKGIKKNKVKDNSEQELDKSSEEGGVKVDKKEKEAVKEELDSTQTDNDVSEVKEEAIEESQEETSEEKAEAEEVAEKSEESEEKSEESESSEEKEEKVADDKKAEEEETKEESDESAVEETKAMDSAIAAIAEELDVSEEKVREALAPLMSNDASEEEPSEEVEMSEEEIKELIDGKSEEKSEENKEASADLEQKVSELGKTVQQLAEYIKEKVKTIEVDSSKKSLVKKENPEVVKEEKKEKDGDAEFLDFLKGNK